MNSLSTLKKIGKGQTVKSSWYIIWLSEKLFKIWSQYSKLIKKTSYFTSISRDGWLKKLHDCYVGILTKNIIRDLQHFSFSDNKKLLSLVLLSNLICTAIMEIMHGNIIPWKHHNIALITNTLYHNIRGSSISSWILGHLKNILQGRMTHCSALQRKLNVPWGKMTFQSEELLTDNCMSLCMFTKAYAYKKSCGQMGWSQLAVLSFCKRFQDGPCTLQG